MQLSSLLAYIDGHSKILITLNDMPKFLHPLEKWDMNIKVKEIKVEDNVLKIYCTCSRRIEELLDRGEW